jgi:cell division protein ZapE
MDAFFKVLPHRRKRRVHFHEFMREIHARLRALSGQEDPLDAISTDIARELRLLAFDEFHVADIADAMILARLLELMIAKGVVMVLTSNYRPDDLYPNGLQRARFLPAIALIERHCAIVRLLAAQDYRLRELSRAGVYFTPLGAAAEQALDACFGHIAPCARRPEAEIVVNGRAIAVKRRAEGVIWFDFAALCEGPRAVADYIELAQSFNTVLISGVPRFSPQMEDAARRFVNLIDEFYDHGVNLVLSAAAAPAGLYGGERLRAEFARTQSRLIEMQSSEYLARAHRQ